MELDLTSQLVTAAILVNTIPAPTDFQPKALVTIPGMGEKYRVSLPIQFWDTTSTHFLLIAGGSEEIILNFSDKDQECIQIHQRSIFCQPYAANTVEQTDWIIAKCQELKIESFIFYAPAYHITRAYLTLLKSMLKAESSLVMVQQTLPVSPHNTVPLADHAPAYKLIPSEVARITTYQEKGDVATLEELLQYLGSLYPALGIELMT